MTRPSEGTIPCPVACSPSRSRPSPSCKPAGRSVRNESVTIDSVKWREATEPFSQYAASCPAQPLRDGRGKNLPSGRDDALGHVLRHVHRNHDHHHRQVTHEGFPEPFPHSAKALYPVEKASHRGCSYSPGSFGSKRSKKSTVSLPGPKPARCCHGSHAPGRAIPQTPQ